MGGRTEERERGAREEGVGGAELGEGAFCSRPQRERG